MESWENMQMYTGKERKKNQLLSGVKLYHIHLPDQLRIFLQKGHPSIEGILLLPHTVKNGHLKIRYKSPSGPLFRGSTVRL